MSTVSAFLRIVLLAPFLFCLFVLPACSKIELYEKAVAIPGHSWHAGFTPSFTFNIKDTSSPYKIYFIIRHTDKYNFNNIYINVKTQQPGLDSVQTTRFDCALATNEKGWLGAGMDDIFEHRIELNTKGNEFYFRKKGEYTFTIEHIMRQEPLEHVLNAGLRIEKITQQ